MFIKENKEGKVEYQQLNFKYNLIISGLSKGKYQSLIQILIKEFDISYYQFRELNNEANEFVNLFEKSCLNEKKMIHGLYYIRMVNLANYDYFIRGKTSSDNQEAHYLNSICFNSSSLSLYKSKKNNDDKIKSNFKNKFYRVGYLSISESSVPHQFIKYAFKNLISYINCIKISPYPFLEQIDGISKSIQHHCQELEIISYSVELPRGNYLRNFLQKFPHIETLTLNTSSDILIEEILRLLPVEDIHNIIENNRNAEKFKSIFDRSQRLNPLPENLSRFNFRSDSKISSNPDISNPNKIILTAWEVIFVVRQGTLWEKYTVRSDNFCFNFTHKSINLIYKQKEVEEDTLVINDALRFMLNGYWALVNYEACILENQYFDTNKSIPIFQIRMKIRDILCFHSKLLAMLPQLNSPMIEYMKKVQSLISYKNTHLSLKLSKYETELIEDEEYDETDKNDISVNMIELDLFETEFKSIDISELNFTPDEFNVLAKQISNQKLLETLSLNLNSLDQLNSLLNTIDNKVTIENLFIKVTDQSIYLNVKWILKIFGVKRRWINKIQVNDEIIHCRALTIKISC